MPASRTMLDRIICAHRTGDTAVVGTLVDLEGNGYRRPGARLLVRTDGSYVGAISGGCLERDLARNAHALVRTGPQLVRIDTRTGTFGAADHYGTGCDGIVHLFFEDPTAAVFDALSLIDSARRASEAMVLVTVHAADGAWRSHLGTMGWRTATAHQTAPELPKLLAETFEQITIEVLTERRTRSLHLVGADGSLHALIEFRAPAPELVIVGTGEDAQSLAILAAPLGFRIWVLGSNAMRLSVFDTGRCIVPARPVLADLPFHSESYVVFMSHDLAMDAALLPLAFDAAPAYIGLLGPRRRTAKLMTALHAKNRLPAPEDVARLNTPVGLDIGGDDPTEVALAILAQVVACKNGRAGGQLGAGQIHPRHLVDRRTLGAEEQSA